MELARDCYSLIYEPVIAAGKVATLERSCDARTSDSREEFGTPEMVVADWMI